MNFNIENSLSNRNVFNEIINEISSFKTSQNKITISPLHGFTKAFLIKELSNKLNQLVVLVKDAIAAEELNVELSLIGLNERTILIDDLNPEQIQPKLTEVNTREKFTLISTYNILDLKLPSKKIVNNSISKIRIGGELAFDELVEYLNLIGYQKDQFVETPGEFSIRGSIIDFWSHSEHNPNRLEFDGDFIESIRYFDPESQRSIEKVDNVTLAAAFRNGEFKSSSGIFDFMDNPVVLASSYDLKNFNFNSSSVINKNSGRPGSVKIVENADDEFPEPNIMTNESTFQQSFQLKDFTETENTIWLLEEEIGSSKDRIELGFLKHRQSILIMKFCLMF
jgi:transcription-repair coupling factor (superfamily II helicase)